MIVLYILVGMVLAAILWFVVSIILAAISSYYEVQTAPREPMYICKVHGPIKKENLIIFSNYEYVEIDPTTNKPVRKVGDYERCMLCFHGTMRQMETIPYEPLPIYKRGLNK